MLYLGKYLPPIYFCLFHPPCHWANNMSGRIQNKYLITTLSQFERGSIIHSIVWVNSIQGEIVFQMYKGEKKDRVKTTLGTVFYWF